MKKLLALLMIWLLLPIAGAEETYTMQDGSLILLDGAGRKCQPIAMKPDFPEALLADADISGAIQLNLPETLLPYVSDELTGGETLTALYCTTELIAMHRWMWRMTTCCAWRTGRIWGIMSSER